MHQNASNRILIFEVNCFCSMGWAPSNPGKGGGGRGNGKETGKEEGKAGMEGDGNLDTPLANG